MRVIGGIVIFLALVALGILIYGGCTDQSFIEAVTTIWQAITGTGATPSPAPALEA